MEWFRGLERLRPGSDLSSVIYYMTLGLVFSILVPHFLICEHRFTTWGGDDIGSLVVLLWGKDADNGGGYVGVGTGSIWRSFINIAVNLKML